MEAMLQSAFSGPLGPALIGLLNRSAAGAALICAVVLLRALLGKAPKWTRCILWAIVAVQLVLPVSLRSPLSVYGLLPRSNGVPEEQVEVFRAGGGSEKPLLVLDTPQIVGYASGVLTEGPSEQPQDAALPRAPGLSLPFAGAVWLAGLGLMLLYALASYLSLRRRVRASLPLEGKVFLCDSIDTPFLLGLFRPRIYLPSGLDAAQRRAVLLHENAHLRRLDHWWKLLGWLLLAVHWFNPLVWLAYVLFCRDLELACDEKVVGKLDAAGRADYSQVLLDCAAPRRAVRACPLAFGEVGLKERIKAVLNYKKPAFWLVLLALAVCVAVALCFLTRPAPIEATENPPSAVTPTPRPTDPPMRSFSAETAKTYFLEDSFYPESEHTHMFTITLDEDAGLFQYYETPFSSHIGMGAYERSGDILILRDGGMGERVNRFRLENDRLCWIEEGSDNFFFIQLTDGACFRRKEAWTRPMTMEDVLALAEKGEALTWEDLLRFEGTDIGSGWYVYRFPIDGEYCLEVSDGKLSGTPQRVLLVAADEAGNFAATPGLCVDIRGEDLAAFLSRPRGPYLTVTSGGQSAAAAAHLQTTRLWSDEHQTWIDGDGAPAAVLLEHPERIPTLILGEDFSLTFGGGAVRKSGLMVYDEQFQLLRRDWYGNTALNWLEPNYYLCCVEVHGPLGRYIPREDAYEETVSLCVFRLFVPQEGPAPFAPEEAHDLTEARLRFRGEDYLVTDAEALAQLETWFSGATELVGGAACPFDSLLVLTRADGSSISLCPAEDRCGTAFSNGIYYRYASDNEALWALFGVELW